MHAAMHYIYIYMSLLSLSIYHHILFCLVLMCTSIIHVTYVRQIRIACGLDWLYILGVSRNQLRVVFFLHVQYAQSELHTSLISHIYVAQSFFFCVHACCRHFTRLYINLCCWVSVICHYDVIIMHVTNKKSRLLLWMNLKIPNLQRRKSILLVTVIPSLVAKLMVGACIVSACMVYQMCQRFLIGN